MIQEKGGKPLLRFRPCQESLEDGEGGVGDVRPLAEEQENSSKEVGRGKARLKLACSFPKLE